jgi:hypothetical protein
LLESPCNDRAWPTLRSRIEEQRRAAQEGNQNVTEAVETLTCDRDRHFFAPGPKRILALDGGGVRGAITVAFLEKIEQVLSDRFGHAVRLGDWFDFVGGTSTGALIAGALVLGYRTSEVRAFYTERAQLAFKRPFWRIPVLQAKFDALALRREIEHVVGDLELGSTDLVTGLCVITKRMDTGSPWIVANNPRAPFWDTPPDESFLGNRHYKLASLVRASTAAPHFFDPEMLSVVDDRRTDPLSGLRSAARQNPSLARFVMGLIGQFGSRKSAEDDRRAAFFDSKVDGLFVDGGVTPHNNPSLMLFLMSILKPYNIRWETGPENLSIVSIGTGTHRPRLEFDKLGFGRFPKLALHALMSLMTDAETLVLMQMQWLGECLTAWEINSELGTLCDNEPKGGKMFKFMRYDVKLEREWMRDNLQMQVSESDLLRFRCMDDPTTISEIYEIGRRAAEMQVKESHWQGMLPRWCAGPRPSPSRRGSPTGPVALWTRTTETVKQLAGALGKAMQP